MTAIQSALTIDNNPASPDYSNINGLSSAHYNILKRFIRSNDIFANYDKFDQYQINGDIAHEHNHPHTHDSDDHGHDHHDHHHDYEYLNCTGGMTTEAKNLLIAKVTAMLVLFTASMVCGLIPFKLSQWLKWSETMGNGKSAKGNFTGNIISMLLAFGGGVLLCTTFLHMLPEVIENIQVLQANNQMPNFMGIESIHYGELLMCIGFFTMYLVEEVVHIFIHRYKHHYGETEAENAFERGMSIRNSSLMRRKICNCDETGKVCSNCKKSRENGKSAFKARFSNKKKESISVTELISNSNDLENGSINSINDLGIYDSTQLGHFHSIGEKQYDGEHVNELHNTDHHNHNEVLSPKQQSNEHNNHHHQHHNGGGHSHLPISTNNDNDVIVSSLRGLLIVLALSVHELFEGFAVGLEQSTVNVWYMFGAVATHKLVIAFCVGVELIVNKTKSLLAVLYIFTFAIVSPLGIGIGAIISMSSECSPNGKQLNDETLVIFDQIDDLSNLEFHDNGTGLVTVAGATPSLAAVILQGLATGTLLYVVFFEILIKTRIADDLTSNSVNRLLQYVAVLFGFIIMFGLQFLCMLHLFFHFFHDKKKF